MAEPQWFSLYKAALPDQTKRDKVTAHFKDESALRAKIEQLQAHQGLAFTTGSLGESLLAALPQSSKSFLHSSLLYIFLRQSASASIEINLARVYEKAASPSACYHSAATFSSHLAI